MGERPQSRANTLLSAVGALGCYTPDDIETRIAELETLLADVTRDNGGTNEACNGLGSLIIGYEAGAGARMATTASTSAPATAGPPSATSSSAPATAQPATTAASPAPTTEQHLEHTTGSPWHCPRTTDPTREASTARPGQHSGGQAMALRLVTGFSGLVASDPAGGPLETPS